MAPLTIPGPLRNHRRFSLEVEPFALLPWLARQPFYPKCYWHSQKEKKTKVALGKLLSFPYIPLLTSPDMCVFGGTSFPSFPFKEGVWEKWPRSYFFLPQVEIHQDVEATRVFFHFVEGVEPSISMEKLSFSSFLWQEELSPYQTRNDSPPYATWKAGVESLLDAIHSSTLEKAVIARATTLSFQKSLCPFFLLDKLSQEVTGTTLFALQLFPEETFLGATPEKLYTRFKKEIKSDAVAGTRPIGKTAEETKQLEKELITSPKEMREFSLVKSFIQSTLSSYCSSFHASSEEVLSTGSVQHLYSQIFGNLKKEVTDQELLEALHPTPAVAGLPREEALKHIGEKEPFSRGWYAGSLGWVTAEEADLAVAIRSGLIKEKALTLFAATGIVEGSHPEKEWEELEQKIAPFMRILG